MAPNRHPYAPATSATLTSLPPEVLQIIGSHLAKPNEPRVFSALAALTATCRLTYWNFIELLYRTDAVNPRGSVALLWGAATGQVKTMERAVEYGADINWKDDVGDVMPDPRKMAAGHRIFGYGLRGDPKRFRKRRGTPLHFAVKMGQDQAVTWLLDHGARHDIGSRELCHCHMFGIRQWQTWRPMIYSPFWYPLHTAICYDRLSTFRILVSRGASLDKICAGRSYQWRVYPTALQNAAYAGNEGIFNHVLNQPGAAGRLRANFWPTSLSSRNLFEPNLLNLVYMGSGMGNRDSRAQIIQELVRRGIRSEKRAETGESALFRACKGGAFGIAFDLIHFGACLPAVLESSHTLLYHVLKAPKELYYPRLDEDDAYSDYYWARPKVQQRDRLDLVKLFVTRGYVNINHMWYQEEITGETAAMLATRPTNTAMGSVEAVEFVRRLGANLQKVNLNVMNPLHYLVKQLTSPDTSPNAKGRPRNGAFTSSSTIKYLLQDARLELDFTDAEGKTALDYLYDAVGAIIKEELRSRSRSEETLHSWDKLTVHLAATMLGHCRLPRGSPWFMSEASRLGKARQTLMQQKCLVDAARKAAEPIETA